MSAQNTTGLIRTGVWALPLAGVLLLITGLANFGSPDPSANPTVAARAASTTGYFLSQFAGNVLGVTVAIFGVVALFAYLADIGRGRLASWAMISCILGFGILLSFLGVVTYVFPALSRAYLGGQHDVFKVAGAIFGSVFPIVVVGNLLIFIGFVMFGVVIWRSGVLPRAAGALLAIAALVLGLPTSTPIIMVVGTVLLIVAGGWIALSVMRAPSGPAEAQAQPRVR